MRKKAFTLLELLITVVLFVVVAGIATATFSLTARFQFLSKQSQNASSELQSGVRVMTGAIERAVSTDPLRQPAVIKDGVGAYANNMLITYTQKQQADGTISGVGTDNEWHVYCIQTDGALRRLVRYTLTNAAAYNAAATGATCIRTSISAILFNGAAIQGPDYLTSESIDVTALHFWKLSYAGATPNPMAIRMEIVGVYDPTNATNAEARVSDALSNPNPIVIRTVANRIDPNLGRLP